MANKKLISALLAFLMLLSVILTGCGDTTDPAKLAKKAQKTVAVTVGDHKINAVELNYYYMETVNSFCNEYSYYIYYLMDVTKPLNTQVFDEQSGQTWADYFLELALSNLKGTYTLYDAALKAGMCLSDADEKSVQDVAESIRYYAEYYGFDDVEAYMVELFGYGATLETYCDYFRTNLLADLYYAAYYESLDFTQEKKDAYEAKSPLVYNAYDLAYYTVYASEYLTNGKEDAEGNAEYTDAQKAQALVQAENDAKLLAAGTYTDAASFNQAIASLPVNASLASVSCTEKYGQLYAEISTTFQEWISSSDRNIGDTTVVAKTTTTDDVTVTDGYYVVLYLGMNDNRFALKNVRHLLVSFADSTQEAKDQALAEAESLLQQWKDGAATEASFMDLANANSDDGKGTTGGLYENVFPGQMAESFEQWCYDEGRQHGDTGIVESEYGYHIMFFVSDSDMTYREYMVLTNLRAAEVSTWYSELLDSTQLQIKSTDYVALDLILSP